MVASVFSGAGEESESSAISKCLMCRAIIIISAAYRSSRQVNEVQTSAELPPVPVPGCSSPGLVQPPEPGGFAGSAQLMAQLRAARDPAGSPCLDTQWGSHFSQHNSCLAKFQCSDIGSG